MALTSTGRVVIGGTDQTVAGARAARLIGTVERPLALSVSGADSGTAKTFVPNTTKDGYVPSTTVPVPTISSPFGAGVATRTATGDFNGDGIFDTVFVTGPGVKGAMAVVNGKDGSSLLGSTDPIGDVNFTSGLYVTAGDIDGDGRWEWGVTPQLLGGPRIIIFRFLADGTFNITTGDRPSLVANFFGFSDPNFRGGAQATIGDLTSDGVQDVAIIAAINGGPRADLYDGKNVLAAKAAGTDPAKLTNDFFADGTTTGAGRGGQSIALLDVNGDGKADLVTTGDFTQGTGNQILIYNGSDLATGKIPGAGATPISTFTVSGFSTNAVTTLAGTDVDGDNKAELVVGPGGSGSVKTYLGKNIGATGEPTSTSLDPAIGTSTIGVTVG